MDADQASIRQPPSSGPASALRTTLAVTALSARPSGPLRGASWAYRNTVSIELPFTAMPSQNLIFSGRPMSAHPAIPGNRRQGHRWTPRRDRRRQQRTSPPQCSARMQIVCSVARREPWRCPCRRSRRPRQTSRRSGNNTTEDFVDGGVGPRMRPTTVAGPLCRRPAEPRLHEPLEETRGRLNRSRLPAVVGA